MKRNEFTLCMYQAVEKDSKDGKDSKDSGDKKAHITTQIKLDSNQTQFKPNQMNQNKLKKIRIILLVINFTIVQKIMITKSNSNQINLNQFEFKSNSTQIKTNSNQTNLKQFEFKLN